MEVLTDSALRVDTKADFADKANLEAVAARLKGGQIDAAFRADEEHDAWMVVLSRLDQCRARALVSSCR